MRVFDDARSPMAGGHVRNLKRTLLVRVPPFEFDDVLETEIGNEVEDMVRDNQRGGAAGLEARLARDRAQGVTVKMIEVSMRHQHKVHRGQVAQTEAGAAQPLEYKEPAGKVGIDDDIPASDLEKEARMPYERDAEIAL